MVDGSFASSSFKQDTKATIGQGTLTVGVPDANVTINRDVDASQVVTKDKSTGFTLYADVAAFKELVSTVKGVAGNKEAAGNSVILQGVNNIANDPLRLVKDVAGEVNAIFDKDITTESQTGELVRLVALKLGLEASGAQTDKAIEIELARAKPELDKVAGLRDAALARAAEAERSGDTAAATLANAEAATAQGVINTITKNAVTSGVVKVASRTRPGAPQNVLTEDVTKGSALVSRDGNLAAGTGLAGALPFDPDAEIVVTAFKEGTTPTIGRFVVNTAVETKAFVEGLNDTFKIAAKTGIGLAVTGGTKPLIDLGVDLGGRVILPALPNAILDPLARGSAAITTFIGDGGTAFLVGSSGNVLQDFRTTRNDTTTRARTDSDGVSYFTGLIFTGAVAVIGTGAKVVLNKRGGPDVVDPNVGRDAARRGDTPGANADSEAGDPASFTNGRGPLVDYEKISTAKPGQAIKPRDLNEQVLFNQVIDNPAAGRKLDLSGDPRFKASDGFQKLEAIQKLPDGTNITIHYQYNSVTGKAYDIKFVTPQRVPPPLQPGPSIRK
ncbi:MAG: hypothetical protein AABY88_02075 [Pseudomonadota bacterium]